MFGSFIKRDRSVFDLFGLGGKQGIEEISTDGECVAIVDDGGDTSPRRSRRLRSKDEHKVAQQKTDHEKKSNCSSLKNHRKSSSSFYSYIQPVCVAIVAICVLYFRYEAHRQAQFYDTLFDMEEMESTLIHDLYNDNDHLTVERRWTEMVVFDQKERVSIKVHHIIANDNKISGSSALNSNSSSQNQTFIGEKKKPPMMLLHGYGSSSLLAWRNVIPELAHEYEIFAVDLPAFGRSTAPLNLAQMNEAETLDFYCQFFDTYQKEVGIKTPYVVAHSFGGFLFTHCSSRYPHLASKVMLAAVPGFFSNNGGLDYYWAMFFKTALPQTLIRTFFNGVNGIERIIQGSRYLKISWPERVIKYWHGLQLHPSLQSGMVLSKFVKYKYLYAIGSSIALVPLLNMSVPVNLLYGEKDSMVPPHQGQFIQEVANSVSKSVIANVFIVKNGTHVPYAPATIDEFTRYVIQASHTTTQHAFSTTERLKSQELATCLQEASEKWSTWPCLPLRYFSDRSMKMMYTALRQVKQQCSERESRQ